MLHDRAIFGFKRLKMKLENFNLFLPFSSIFGAKVNKFLIKLQVLLQVIAVDYGRCKPACGLFISKVIKLE